MHRTPLLRSATLSEQLGIDARFKAELFQRTGSFKVRGALNRLSQLTDEEKRRGVISISAGNHAQAVAWAAREEGIDALIVMWQGADELKVAATRGYGAAIDQEAEGPTTAFDRLDELLVETGRTLVHPFNDAGGDRRPGNGRARDPRGRPRARRRHRAGRRRRSRHRRRGRAEGAAARTCA